MRFAPPNADRRRRRALLRGAVLTGLTLGLVAGPARAQDTTQATIAVPGPLAAIAAVDEVAWGVVDATGQIVRLDLAAGASEAISPGGPRPPQDAPLHTTRAPAGGFLVAQGRTVEVFADGTALYPISRRARLDLPLEVGCGDTDPLAGAAFTPGGALVLVTERGGVAVAPDGSGPLPPEALRTLELPGLDCAGPERVAPGVALAGDQAAVVATDRRLVRVELTGDQVVVAAEAARRDTGAPGAGPVWMADGDAGVVAVTTPAGVEVWAASATATAPACALDLGGPTARLLPLAGPAVLAVSADGSTVRRIGADCQVAWSVERVGDPVGVASGGGRVAATTESARSVALVTLDAETGSPVDGARTVPDCDTAVGCRPVVTLTGDGLPLVAGPTSVTAMPPAPAGGQGGSPPDTPASPITPDPGGDTGGSTGTDSGATPGTGTGTPAPGGSTGGTTEGSGESSGAPAPGSGAPTTGQGSGGSLLSPGGIPLPSTPPTTAYPGVIGTIGGERTPRVPAREPRTPVPGAASALSLSDLLASGQIPGAAVQQPPDDLGARPPEEWGSQSTGRQRDTDPYAAGLTAPDGSATAAAGSLETDEIAAGAPTTPTGSDAGALVVLLVVGIAVVLVVVVASRSADRRRAAARS